MPYHDFLSLKFANDKYNFLIFIKLKLTPPIITLKKHSFIKIWCQCEKNKNMPFKLPISSIIELVCYVLDTTSTLQPLYHHSNSNSLPTSSLLVA